MYCYECVVMNADNLIIIIIINTMIMMLVLIMMIPIIIIIIIIIIILLMTMIMLLVYHPALVNNINDKIMIIIISIVYEAINKQTNNYDNAATNHGLDVAAISSPKQLVRNSRIGINITKLHIIKLIVITLIQTAKDFG